MTIDTINTDLISLVKQKFKLFAIVAIVALIASIVFSSSVFITPKYKSDAALYASNIDSYSNESSTEQLLQFLEGNDIRDSIIKKFDLITHYEIDSASEGYLHNLHNEFIGNVSIGKTSYESVNIEVFDKDPVLAKKIVDEFIHQVNIKIRKLHQSKAQEVVVIRQSQLAEKQSLIDKLESEIKKYATEYGLLDYTQQSREVTAAYMEILAKGSNSSGSKKAEELFKNMTKEGRHFHDLHQQLSLARDDYNKILIDYELALNDTKKTLTYTNTIVYPEVADKKSYPIRWIIVVMSVVASLLFTLMVILIKQKLNRL